MTPSEDKPKVPVIETASGTTSPDNSKSGSFAYIVALITVIALGLMGTALSSCVRFTGDMFQEAYTQDLSDNSGDDFFDDDFFNDDFFNDEFFDEDYFDQYDNQDEVTDTGQSEGLGLGSHTVKDVLSGDLKLYSLTIDSSLPASAYANAQQPVRSFVRELVVADRDATADIATELRTTAWSDGDIAAAIQNAKARADQAVEEIRAMQMPETTGENASTISHGLEVGKSDALKRWEAIVAELDLFASRDTIMSSELRSVDNDLQDATYNAAESFSSALSDSASI